MFLVLISSAIFMLDLDLALKKIVKKKIVLKKMSNEEYLLQRHFQS